MFSNVLWCFLVFCIGSFLNFPKVWSQWCNLFLGMPPFLWCFLMFFLRYLRMFGVNGVICCRKGPLGDSFKSLQSLVLIPPWTKKEENKKFPQKLLSRNLGKRSIVCSGPLHSLLHTMICNP